ncbi:hypothetical protein [Nesterenkonia flava]|uniref:DUF916 domain-containing protein n=1 Tax=Nesterenkonia flava TaxID=469799 RepID=A0ABU1FWE7_9MICC|nr:hypothetical protein [Nesterenkonia flava]MDR5712996.1 hypothetical protein [Nesterenkonia flava]
MSDCTTHRLRPALRWPSVILAAVMLVIVQLAVLLPTVAAASSNPVDGSTEEGSDEDHSEPAGEDSGGRTTWSITPGEDGQDAEPHISLRTEIEPGESAEDTVTVTNFSDHPASFVVYASDGLITEDGQFDVLPSSDAPEAAGSWITVGEDTAPGEPVTVELEPESDITLPVSITVPEARYSG